jgi:hypothetical protein
LKKQDLHLRYHFGWSQVLQKIYAPLPAGQLGLFCFCGINRFAFYSTVKKYFSQKPCFSKILFQGRVATMRTNEAYAGLNNF